MTCRWVDGRMRVVRASGVTPVTPSGIAEVRPAQLRVVPPEPVLQEVAQVALFLADEALLRQLAVEEQVDHRGDAGGGRDLDRAHQLAVDLLRIDLLGIALLRQAAVAHAGDDDEDQHHVLVRDRHRRLEHVLEQVAALLQPQVVQQHLHDVAVAGIAHGLVVEVLDLAVQRLAQRAEAAGGVERTRSRCRRARNARAPPAAAPRSACRRGSPRTDCSIR